MIGFYIFLIFEKALMILPKRARRIFFISLANIAYIFSHRYKKVVRDNLYFIYGKDIDEEFITKITKYSFKQLLLNLMHTIEARYFTIEEMAKNVEFENIEVVKQAQKENRAIVFITAHYGSWELGGSMISAFVQPITTVYKKMKNPYFQEYLSTSRTKWNIKYIERHGATKGLLKELRSGNSIALLIDTNISKKDGIIVDFLNKPTSQIKTTAFFARKFNAAIIPVLIHTDDDEKYTIKFYDEIIPPKTEDEKSDIKISTQMQTDWLTQEIFKKPEPWFWLHRRFKTDYPEIYR